MSVEVAVEFPGQGEVGWFRLVGEVFFFFFGGGEALYLVITDELLNMCWIVRERNDISCGSGVGRNHMTGRGIPETR
jgi:hypothetical protein